MKIRRAICYVAMIGGLLGSIVTAWIQINVGVTDPAMIRLYKAEGYLPDREMVSRGEAGAAAMKVIREERTGYRIILGCGIVSLIGMLTLAFWPEEPPREFSEPNKAE